jgi:hypothetical protein
MEAIFDLEYLLNLYEGLYSVTKIPNGGLC